MCLDATADALAKRVVSQCAMCGGAEPPITIQELAELLFAKVVWSNRNAHGYAVKTVRVATCDRVVQLSEGLAKQLFGMLFGVACAKVRKTT